MILSHDTAACIQRSLCDAICNSFIADTVIESSARNCKKGIKTTMEQIIPLIGLKLNSGSPQLFVSYIYNLYFSDL